jgi:hypothetical protein
MEGRCHYVQLRSLFDGGWSSVMKLVMLVEIDAAISKRVANQASSPKVVTDPWLRKWRKQRIRETTNVKFAIIASSFFFEHKS